MFNKNNPAPALDPQIHQALRDIGLTPSGLPIFQCIWGQAWEDGHTWTQYGEVAHRYRHHWKRDYAMAEPVYDLAGQFQGYGKLYYYGDVQPPAGLLVPVELKTSIGVPRWYFEIAMPIDEAEWENLRRDEAGKDQWGECPRGLVEYFPLSIDGKLMRFETHDRRMVEFGREQIPYCCAESMPKKCYGEYRAPTMRDVDMVRRMWKENGEPRDFFKVDPTRQAWATDSANKEAMRDEQCRILQHADDMKQAMSMISENRLKGEGSGLDLHKYSYPEKVMPGTELKEPNVSTSNASNNA